MANSQPNQFSFVTNSESKQRTSAFVRDFFLPLAKAIIILFEHKYLVSSLTGKEPRPWDTKIKIKQRENPNQAYAAKIYSFAYVSSEAVSANIRMETCFVYFEWHPRSTPLCLVKKNVFMQNEKLLAVSLRLNQIIQLCLSRSLCYSAEHTQSVSARLLFIQLCKKRKKNFLEPVENWITMVSNNPPFNQLHVNTTNLQRENGRIPFFVRNFLAKINAQHRQPYRSMSLFCFVLYSVICLFSSFLCNQNCKVPHMHGIIRNGILFLHKYWRKQLDANFIFQTRNQKLNKALLVLFYREAATWQQMHTPDYT